MSALDDADSLELKALSLAMMHAVKLPPHVATVRILVNGDTGRVMIAYENLREEAIEVVLRLGLECAQAKNATREVVVLDS